MTALATLPEAPYLEAFLQTAGLVGAQLTRLQGGGNNRVFRVDTAGPTLLLKAYFRHPDDPRDRLKTEFSFTRFAWQNGLRTVPQPVAAAPIQALGLYEFIHGRRLSPDEVSPGHVEEAVSFFAEVNAHRHHPTARGLSAGSEAWFTLTDHFRCTEARLEHLNEIEVASDVDGEARQFVQRILLPAATDLLAAARSRAARLGLAQDQELTFSERCLSPSDFGFHNAILTPAGRLRFVDFEYAGWDDPAKTVLDFFFSPAAPVPWRHFRYVASSMLSVTPDPARHFGRLSVLLPVYGLKWCCIMLNDFMPGAAERRRFAFGTGKEGDRKATQLDRAAAALQNLLVIDVEHLIG